MFTPENPLTIQRQIEIKLDNIRVEAIKANLMPADGKLYYDRGARGYAIAPAVFVLRVGETCQFVPRFNSTTTQREVLAALTGAYEALFAVNRGLRDD